MHQSVPDTRHNPYTASPDLGMSGNPGLTTTRDAFTSAMDLWQEEKSGDDEVRKTDSQEERAGDASVYLSLF